MIKYVIRFADRTNFKLFAFCMASAAVSGCSMMTAAGPSAGRVGRADGAAVANSDIKIIDVSDAVASRIFEAAERATFAGRLGDVAPASGLVGRGDTLDIAIWEAPPAVLFGSAMSSTEALQASAQTARTASMPEQMVGVDGAVHVPFIGAVGAEGRTTSAIATDIKNRLKGLAHDPQVVVRVLRNASQNVTVVGDVTNSGRVPLSPRGERLLDALAAAGGVRQAVNKITIQITRGPEVVAEPLESVIRDPRQNIRLKADDVITAYYQPFSFTALGAVSSNAEIPFESTGITLAQALGRVGGLNDQRANAAGVFLFRLEDPAVLGSSIASSSRKTPDGKIPVIYRVDLKNPASFFLAQNFAIKNKDVLFVSNAPIADLQKFVNIISSVVVPAITVQNATR